jgi:N12 class adenine-specific DNA methylase
MDIIIEIKAIIKNIIGENISDKLANEFYQCATKNEKFGNNPMELIKEVAEYSKTQNIKKGFIGWFKTTVSNYEKPIKFVKVDTFNNYEQRNYDYDDLEKKLLGRN